MPVHNIFINSTLFCCVDPQMDMEAMPVLSMPCGVATSCCKATAESFSPQTTCAPTLLCGVTGPSRWILERGFICTWRTWRLMMTANTNRIRSTWMNPSAIWWTTRFCRSAGERPSIHPPPTFCMWCCWLEAGLLRRTGASMGATSRLDCQWFTTHRKDSQIEAWLQTHLQNWWTSVEHLWSVKRQTQCMIIMINI